MNGDLISRSAVCAKCGAKEDGEMFSCSDECLIFPGNVPAVDAVEVVRCKDCKYYWAPDADFYDSVCKRHKGLVGPTDESYCSYGERKDNG